MKETNEKKIFKRSYDNAYEELFNDGREYSPDIRLESLNLHLQTSKFGVVVTGLSGTGKTALIRQFANQELNRVFKTNSVKIFHIKNLYSDKDIDQFLDCLSNLILNNPADAIILYAKIQKVADLKNIQSIVETYFCDIAKFYDLEALKVIIEVTTEGEKEMNEVYKTISSEFSLIYCSIPENVKATIQLLMPRIDEFSVNYSVGYSNDILEFYYVFAYGEKDINKTITKAYLDVLEKAFIISKKNGSKILQKEAIKDINKEKYEKIQSLSEHDRLVIASHETAHALLRLVSDERVGFCSIIPGTFYSGVCVGDEEISQKFKIKDEQFYLNRIAISLAGRMGEAKIEKRLETSNSATVDLKQVMKIINFMLFNAGLSQSLGKNYVLLENDKMSDALTVRVEAEKREILKKAEQIVKTNFLEHEEFFKRLSKKVADDLYICSDELYNMWNQYLETKKNLE